jgi:hypothetical protein
VAFNRTTIGTATQFVAHSPDWPDEAPELHASMQELIAERSGFVDYQSAGVN